MGDAYFEMGDQARSLRRIFNAGMSVHEVEVVVAGQVVKVYMLATRDFDFQEYLPDLQQMATGELRLAEGTYFDEVIKGQLGMATAFRCPGVNVWFDFHNDVLWTLSKENLEKLQAALETVKQKWAAKATK
jgi:hypothetical protein